MIVFLSSMVKDATKLQAGILTDMIKCNSVQRFFYTLYSNFYEVLMNIVVLKTFSLHLGGYTVPIAYKRSLRPRLYKKVTS